MDTIQTKIDLLSESVIKARPMLAKLLIDEPIIEYLRPALEWKMQDNIFPQANLLKQIIVAYIARLYDEATATIADDQLKHGWVIETGAHLHIPRRYNSALKKDEAQINPLLFQGQVMWALANQTLGNSISLSLNSGRVPLDNTNSGAYLDLPALKNPITLASKKKHPDSPQSLIPARSIEEINKKIEQIEMYRKQKVLPQEEYEIALQILNNFLKHQSSFSDQVATSHALLMNKILPITQITLDSEQIGLEFIISLLENNESLLHSIFSDSKLRTKFITDLGNIRTGWSNDYSPFYHIANKEEGYRLENYTGPLDPEMLVKGLREKTIHPTGVLKFFALMAEAGICPSGGWTQAGYCTDIRNKGAKFLKDIGFIEQGEALQKMPTYIAAVGPCWGLHKVNDRVELIDAITAILNPSIINMSAIKDMSSRQAFLIAAPTLYEFILEEYPSISYDDLYNYLHFQPAQKQFMPSILQLNQNALLRLEHI